MMERLLFKLYKRDNRFIFGRSAISIRLLFEENCIQEGFVFGDFWVKFERYFEVVCASGLQQQQKSTATLAITASH